MEAAQSFKVDTENGTNWSTLRFVHYVARVLFGEGCYSLGLHINCTLLPLSATHFIPFNKRNMNQTGTSRKSIK